MVVALGGRGIVDHPNYAIRTWCAPGAGSGSRGLCALGRAEARNGPARGSGTLHRRGDGVVLGPGLVLAPLLLKGAVTAVYGGVLAIDRRESRMCVCSEGLKKI